MAKDPAFLFYFQDFMYGTRRFTREERGIYIELICEQADSANGSICKRAFEEILGGDHPRITEKFDLDDNGYYNETLRDHLDKRRKYTNSRKNNMKGHNQHTKRSYERSYDQKMTSHMENVNENVNEDVIVKRKCKKKEKYAEYVSMQKENYETLVEKYGEELTKKMIYVLDNYKGSTGKSYKDDYRAILSWVKDKVLESGNTPKKAKHTQEEIAQARKNNENYEKLVKMGLVKGNEF